MADNIYETPQNNPDVQTAVNAAMKEEKKKKKKKTIIIISVIAAILIIIGVIGSAGSSDENKPDTASTNSSVKADTTEASNNEIGDYKCVVKSAKLTKNWEGKDTVLLTYEFTNNSSNPASFDVALIDRVYQDGIGLETTFLSNDDTDYLDVQIKPGVSKDVRKAYILRNTTTDLEVEIEELISFSDDKIVTTVKLEK